MIDLLKNTNPLLTILTVGSLLTVTSAAQALTLKVTVENQSPDDGIGLSPVWVGFHDGSFDSYNGGLSSQLGLEQIAEDGTTEQISQDFKDNLTYVQGGVSGVFPTTQMGTRVDGVLGDGSIAPGSMVMNTFQVTPDDSNRWFSYVSMLSPSNDYYIANGNPTAWDLTDLFTGTANSIQFNIGLPETITDAGTEVNDFNTSAGNGAYPGLPPGQTELDQGEDENGVNLNVSDAFGDFLNKPANFDTDFPNLDFNNTDLYPNGIGRITISVVPENSTPQPQDPLTVPESSTTVGLMAIAGLFFGAGLRRRNHHPN